MNPFDDLADSLLQGLSDEAKWEVLAQKASDYRRLQEELEGQGVLVMAICSRLLPGTPSKVLNQLLGIGNVPVEKWVEDRRTELAAGLQPGQLLEGRRKRPEV